MPMHDFKCQVCGARRRVWRYEGQEPKYCDRHCKAKGMAGQPSGREKYRITPAQAEQIRKVYRESSGNGEVKALAEKLGLPRWKVTRYAVSNGLLPRTQKEPDWSEAEIEVLERNAHLSPLRIRDRLRQAGFRRSEAGIVLKRKRLQLLGNLNGQSATSLAACFGVDPSTVVRWIEKGLLKARRRGTDRGQSQGGDIYYLQDKHVRQFVIDNPNVVDLRKVDKHWFIDLLTNQL